MKILVTGGSGFIGSHLIKSFKANPWEVTEFQGDITDEADLQRHFFPNCGWDTVVHLAAISAIADCDRDPRHAFQVNAVGTFMIVDKIAKYCPTAKLIFSSTGQVYDLSSSLDQSIDENHPIAPSNTYARTKRAAELYIADTFKAFNGSYVIFRIFNHAHKTQRPDFFMPSIFQQISAGVSTQKEVRLEVGNVDLTRDFGAVQDMIEIFSKVISSAEIKRETYNLSSGVGKSLRKIITEMATALNTKVLIITIPERVRINDPKSVIAMNSKLSIDYHWTPNHARDEHSLVQSFLATIP